MTRRPAPRRARRSRGPSSTPGVASDPARARIRDAAIAEFAARGFEAASTNTIAAEAGVAKGLVFHHFRSKEELFVVAFDHVMARTIDALYTGVGPLPSDLFERLHTWAVHKLRVFQRDPVGYQFLMVAAQELPPSLQAVIEARLRAQRAEHGPRVIEGIDVSRLRDGITPSQALETLMLLGEGIERSLIPRLAALPDRGMSQLDAVSAELWAHFVRLRDGLYGPAPGAGAPRRTEPPG